MESALQKEFDYYLAHQQELVEKYDGKFIVIFEGKVLAAFDDQLKAVTETAKTHKLGTFLVQKVERGAGSYTQTFHSRALFS
jgi:hypothetical protein